MSWVGAENLCGLWQEGITGERDRKAIGSGKPFGRAILLGAHCYI